MATRPTDLLRATRPQQWPKNLLVLAAPLAGGRILEPGILARASTALALFVLASASVYLLNDLLDRDLDVRHPQKRHRPIASGAVTPTAAAMRSIA
jgi:decaprenyl-phosphate phosphoribosyltransferase